MDLQEFGGMGPEEQVSKRKLFTDITAFAIITGCVVVFRRNIERALHDAFLTI